MKEIGGYFQMEQLPGAEYHKNLLRLNLGRTALLYAIQLLGIKKLHLPGFICDSVTAACEKSGAEIRWYHIGKDFLPDGTTIDCDFAAPFREGEYLYLINYYGQLTDEKILALKKQYANIIVDNTHSFFQRPVKDVPTLYSCRKYFGLPDGAYLYLPAETMDTPDNSYEKLPADSSCERMAHILGRLEHSASDSYSHMLSTASSFYEEPIKQMSPLTQNLLRGIDYEQARKRRTQNYRTLDALLASQNPLRLTPNDGPLAYPFYSKDASRLKKELAKQKIFVPTYWNNVIREAPTDSLEWDYASHILPLPIDQRYTEEDMGSLAETLLKLL